MFFYNCLPVCCLVRLLNMHMIRKHGFWGGKGFVFRLESNDVVCLLKMGEMCN